MPDAAVSGVIRRVLQETVSQPRHRIVMDPGRVRINQDDIHYRT